MISYPVNLRRDTNGTILVTFPDVPEAVTFGQDRQEALLRAVDVLESSLAYYIAKGKVIPLPSARKRARQVTLPALTEAKVRLYQSMRSCRMSKAELARRLGCHLPQIDRLLDLDHASRLDQIEAAFRAMGMRLVLEVEAA